MITTITIASIALALLLGFAVQANLEEHKDRRMSRAPVRRR